MSNENKNHNIKVSVPIIAAAIKVKPDYLKPGKPTLCPLYLATLKELTDRVSNRN